MLSLQDHPAGDSRAVAGGRCAMQRYPIVAPGDTSSLEQLAKILEARMSATGQSLQAVRQEMNDALRGGPAGLAIPPRPSVAATRAAAAAAGADAESARTEAEVRRWRREVLLSGQRAHAQAEEILGREAAGLPRLRHADQPGAPAHPQASWPVRHRPTPQSLGPQVQATDNLNEWAASMDAAHADLPSSASPSDRAIAARMQQRLLQKTMSATSPFSLGAVDSEDDEDDEDNGHTPRDGGGAVETTGLFGIARSTSAAKAEQRRLQSTLSKSSPFELQAKEAMDERPGSAAESAEEIHSRMLAMSDADDCSWQADLEDHYSHLHRSSSSVHRAVGAKAQQRALQKTQSSSSTLKIDAERRDSDESSDSDADADGSSTHGPLPTVSNPHLIAAATAGKMEQRRLQATLSLSSPFVLLAEASAVDGESNAEASASTVPPQTNIGHVRAGGIPEIPIPISVWSNSGPAPTVSNPRTMAETAMGKAEQRRLQSTLSLSSSFDLQPQGPRVGAVDMGGPDDAEEFMFAAAGAGADLAPTVSNPRALMIETAEGKSQQRRLQATLSSSSTLVLETSGPEDDELSQHDARGHGPAPTVSNPRTMAETVMGKAEQRRLQSTLSSSSRLSLSASTTDVVPDPLSGPPAFDGPPQISQDLDESGNSLSDVEIMEDMLAAQKAHLASVKFEEALRGPSPAVRRSPHGLVAHDKSAQRAMQQTLSASSPFSLEEDGAASSGSGGRGREFSLSTDEEAAGMPLVLREPEPEPAPSVRPHTAYLPPLSPPTERAGLAGPTKTTSVLRTASDASYSRAPTRSVSFARGSGGTPTPAAGFNTRDLAP